MILTESKLDPASDNVEEYVQMAYSVGTTWYLDNGKVIAKPPNVDVYGKPVKTRPPHPTLDGLPVDEYNAKPKQAERPRCHVVEIDTPCTN